MKRLLFVLLVLVLAGCTNDEGMKSLLQKEGYQNITPTGYQFFSCSEDDFYATGFTATKNGQTVTGTVCEGLFFKGKTIRYE